MSIKFKAVQKLNPAKPTEPKKWYPQAIGDGESTLKHLAEYASQTSTVCKADILAVLETIFTKITQDLAEGKIVKVGEYFTLQVGVSGQASAQEKEVTAAKIKSAKIHFRQGKMLSDMLKTASFRK